MSHQPPTQIFVEQGQTDPAMRGQSVPRKAGCVVRVMRWMLLLIIASVVILAGLWWLRQRGPQPPTPIFQGVVYQAMELPDSPEQSGLVHLIEVDLTAPNIDLYVTPLHPQAVAQGGQYLLKFTGSVVNQQYLAVAINGTLFSSSSMLPGSLARANETAVSEHQVNHVHEHSYLMWFEDDLTPHIEYSKPPAKAALNRARWGISGQAVVIRQGKFSAYLGQKPDARTMLGLDASRRRLWLASFEHASERAAAAWLSQQGVADAIFLDGGSSTSMALGQHVANVRPGMLTTSFRPVAVHFGIRAAALPSR